MLCANILTVLFAKIVPYFAKIVVEKFKKNAYLCSTKEEERALTLRTILGSLFIMFYLHINFKTAQAAYRSLAWRNQCPNLIFVRAFRSSMQYLPHVLEFKLNPDSALVLEPIDLLLLTNWLDKSEYSWEVYSYQADH